MAPVQIRCPNCAREYLLESRLVGRTGRCKHCHQTFSLSPSTMPPKVAATAFPSASESSRPTPSEGAIGHPPAPIELPEHFGHYRILRKLGEGGMGAVFLAQDGQLDRLVALKVPRITHGDRQEILDRFDREARAAALLDHPNLCPIYEVGRIDGDPYLTMPYIEGKPLSAEIDPDKPFPPRQAAAIVRTLALALQEAHDRGIVHRDLKPANIMINRRQELVIMDFGLARRLNHPDPRLTITGALLGTPHYMAPEQAVGDPTAIGPACDIYSLGVILFELLTGRTPFDGPVHLVIARVVFAPDIPRPSEFRPGIDSSLETICLKAMAKGAKDRYVRCSDLAAALQSWIDGRPVDTRGQSEEMHGGVEPSDRSPVVASTGGEAFSPRRSALDSIDRRTHRILVRSLTIAGGLILGLGILVALGIAQRGPAPSNGVAPFDESKREAQTEPVPPVPSQKSSFAKSPMESISEPSTGMKPSEPRAVVSEPGKTKDEIDEDQPLEQPSAPAASPEPPKPLRRKLIARRDEPEIREAIQGGVRFLKQMQLANGSWPDLAEGELRTVTTSMATLSLLTVGEPADSPSTARALGYLQQFTAADLGHTIPVSLQTMVFSAANPDRYRVRITGSVSWLERAQHKPGDRYLWPGSWSDTNSKDKAGDNANSHYALLGLDAANEAGVRVRPEVWALALNYWERYQQLNGGWSYTADDNRATADSTCAGISSLIITGLQQFRGLEVLRDEAIINCGNGGINPSLQRGIDWLGSHFHVDQNYSGQEVNREWKYYYLYGLERAGRLTGLRFFGTNDWYSQGAQHLLHTPERNRVEGAWTGNPPYENNSVIATSFALLFLAEAGSPVLMTKLRHGPANDWNNDPDDIRNFVSVISRDRRSPLAWQVVDPDSAKIKDLLQAPIAYFNGHRSPVLDADGIRVLRAYVEQGGFIFAEACCGEPEFDRGFRDLIKEVFPEANQTPSEYALHPLPPEHPVWRAKHELSPEAHPLWGIEHDGRTAVVYSPRDLSCYWNQAEVQFNNPAVTKAFNVGQNIVTYAVDLDSAKGHSQMADDQQGQKPGDAQGQRTGQPQGRQPGEAQGPTPGAAQGQKPSDTQGQRPGEVQGPRPSDAQGRRPGEAQGPKPGDAQGQRPGEAPSLKPGEAQGQKPGNAQGQQNGAAPGQKPSGIASDGGVVDQPSEQAGGQLTPEQQRKLEDLLNRLREQQPAEAGAARDARPSSPDHSPQLKGRQNPRTGPGQGGQPAQSKPSAPAERLDNPISPDLPQGDPGLRKLHDLLQDDSAARRLEQETGLSRAQMERFARKSEATRQKGSEYPNR